MSKSLLVLSMFKKYLSSVGAIILVILFFVLPSIWTSHVEYSWADKQKAWFKKNFPESRFVFFEQMNNVIEPTEPWQWFKRPVRLLKYVDKGAIIAFAKQPDSLGCKVGGDCPSWTAARIITLIKNDNNSTNISDSIEIIDCRDRTWGFYDSDKKRFRIIGKDKNLSTSFPEKTSDTERNFICKQPEGMYLKDISISELENKLKDWKSLDRTIP